MRVVIDIEANALEKPTEIWCIVCKDIDTGLISIFREVTRDEKQRQAFHQYAKNIDILIGHNILGYDLIVLHDLLGYSPALEFPKVIDTLIVSKVSNYSRPGGHSVEEYGLEFGLNKIKFLDFSKWSQELEDYCVRDVDITHRVYLACLNIIDDPLWKSSLELEHSFQLIVNDLHTNGFYFDCSKASKLLAKVTEELSELDAAILVEFPPRLKLVREITPVKTKHGTWHKKDFKWKKDGDISEYWGDFCLCRWEDFNPASHKQLIEILTEAGWKPEHKTKAHILYEREASFKQGPYNGTNRLDASSQVCYDDYNRIKKYGWKINEHNLNTLPSTAPSPARTLAKRILLESRRRTLTEWLGLVNPHTQRVHGKFVGIGAWTHRMAHQSPNMANIPNEYDTEGNKKLLGKEMRSLWRAPLKRVLVGVDAEGIQLRIFAHYIDDAEFTEALVKGKKEDKSDPHSLNQRILGSVCKSRAAAKRFIYALLLGAGLGKLSEILVCSRGEADEALSRLLERYQGFGLLKKTTIPNDARRGYFEGIDGRRVYIPGDTERDRRHLCMSGYLQNGEAIIMKRAALIFYELLEDVKEYWKLVNLVHDEFQTECKNDMALAIRVAKTEAEAIKLAGEYYKLKCPMAGSYWNDDLKDYTIGTNWSVTH